MEAKSFKKKKSKALERNRAAREERVAEKHERRH